MSEFKNYIESQLWIIPRCRRSLLRIFWYPFMKQSQFAFCVVELSLKLIALYLLALSYLFLIVCGEESFCLGSFILEFTSLKISNLSIYPMQSFAQNSMKEHLLHVAHLICLDIYLVRNWNSLFVDFFHEVSCNRGKALSRNLWKGIH